jgi:hypothetical protein
VDWTNASHTGATDAMRDEKSSEPFRRFQKTMRALLAVPKKEIDEQAKKWKQRRVKSKTPARHIVQ